MQTAVITALLLFGLSVPVACAQGAADKDHTASRSSEPKRIPSEHLPNLYRLHKKVLSGGEPDGETAFVELRDLGVKTLISVDGAKPDVASARKYGLRYVHLPHGYDGISPGRAAELAKAVRDLDGPIYIHCHHGMHRSPAAAATACVALGLLQPDEAATVLRTCGTSPHYRGLYRTVTECRPMGDEQLDKLRVTFVETAAIPPMAQAMVDIEHAFDRLTLLQKSGWRSPPQHPDLEPAHEALLLREQFTELLRTDDVRARPEKFRELIRDSAQAAAELEDFVRSRAGEGNAPPAPQQASAAFKRIAKNCAQCHVTYRDVPLSEQPAHPALWHIQ